MNLKENPVIGSYQPKELLTRSTGYQPKRAKDLMIP